MTDKTEINKKKRAFKDTLKQRQPVAHNIPAVMGDGQGNLRLDNGRVWVLINGVAYKALCTRVAPKYGKQVWVGVSYDGGKRGKVYQVLSDNITKATDPSIIQSGGYVPAGNYEWGGRDPIHVNLRAFTFLRLTEAGGMNVYLDEGKVYNGTNFIAVPGQDIDLSAHIPATAGKALLVLITIDSAGDVVQTEGAEADIEDIKLPSPLPDVIPYLPEIPAGTTFICGAVRVYEGQTEVREGQTETDIVDLRFAWQPTSSGSLNVDFLDDFFLMGA